MKKEHFLWNYTWENVIYGIILNQRIQLMTLPRCVVIHKRTHRCLCMENVWSAYARYWMFHSGNLNCVMEVTKAKTYEHLGCLYGYIFLASLRTVVYGGTVDSVCDWGGVTSIFSPPPLPAHTHTTNTNTPPPPHTHTPPTPTPTPPTPLPPLPETSAALL